MNFFQDVKCKEEKQKGSYEEKWDSSSKESVRETGQGPRCELCPGQKGFQAAASHPRLLSRSSGGPQLSREVLKEGDSRGWALFPLRLYTVGKVSKECSHSGKAVLPVA